ncbi:hypothetical protein [Pontibacter harenae]|uniref:hypothetical protein n=1 Tax=Pontibacter harenae TaxID=2894083 RepID=UPI001E2B2082|nr:hypothetical protein [Pontibacter harenae]MCC9168032.1 hypothetical protein [Pontibacter harenae]
MKSNQNRTAKSKSNQVLTSSTQSGSDMQGASTSTSGTSGKGGLGNITNKLQGFGSSSLDKLNGLSTTQKVIGGSVLALGAGWLAMGSANQEKVKSQIGRVTKNISNKGASGSSETRNLSSSENR